MTTFVLFCGDPGNRFCSRTRCSRIFTLSVSSTIFCSSSWVGLCPNDLMMVPSSFDVIVPSPSLSNSWKAALNSCRTNDKPLKISFLKDKTAHYIKYQGDIILVKTEEVRKIQSLLLSYEIEILQKYYFTNAWKNIATFAIIIPTFD